MINRFCGPYKFLSNFAYSPIQFQGMVYMTVEHAFQACKATSAQDHEFVRSARSPGEAKRRGRQIKKRDDWDQIKLDVMYAALIGKFESPDLRAKLLATGDEMLVEGNNWHDTYWGMCAGEGENHLGRLLMGLRAEIRAGKR